MPNKLVAFALLKGLTIDMISRLLRMVFLIHFPINMWYRRLLSKRVIGACSFLTTTTLVVAVSRWLYFTLYTLFDERTVQLGNIKKQIKNARTVAQWKTLAMEYEKLNKQMFGKRYTHLYDKGLLQNKLAQIKQYNTQDIHQLMNSIRMDIDRNFGNIAKNKLHEHFLHVPNTILQYIDEVKKQLSHIAENRQISKEEKNEFFRELRHIHGRTALLLSGGASLGTFHMGVVKALFEHGVLPRIISGSSVGSIVASIVAVRTDVELRDTFQHLDTLDLSFFGEHNTIHLIRNVIEKGHAQDHMHLIKTLQKVLGNVTFKDAYQKTGRILNITVCPAETNEAPKVMNFMTSPDVLIWSAVAASTAMPGLFPSQYIYVKTTKGDFSKDLLYDVYKRKWQDGSLRYDLPSNALKEMFNCNFFIVSQCNPIVIPLLGSKNVFGSTIFKVIEMEIKHRCKQIKQVLPAWMPSTPFDLLDQPWEGDVTITLPLGFHNPKTLITNPDLEKLILSVKTGEKATWESIWSIECNCAIETYLDDIVQNLYGGSASWGEKSYNDFKLIVKDDPESYSLDYIAL